MQSLPTEPREIVVLRIWSELTLVQISEVTGGTSFTIDNPNDLAQAAKAVGTMLRNQYLLGYRPESVNRDGKWHKIKIKLKQPKKIKFPALRVYAKAGYYAPAE